MIYYNADNKYIVIIKNIETKGKQSTVTKSLHTNSPKIWSQR